MARSPVVVSAPALLAAGAQAAELICPELIAFVLGETATPWWWEYNSP